MMGQCHIGGFGVGGGGYVANAVDFDGTNDYLSKNTQLTGISDSSTGILSYWIRLDASTDFILIQGQNGYIQLQFASQKFKFYMSDSTGTSIFWFQNNTTYSSGATWLHVLASWNTGASAGNKISHLYVNGISNKTVMSDTASSFSINYDGDTVWGVCGTYSGGAKLNGCIAEAYFAPGQFLDFSVQSNREKFALLGKPVDLGSNGSLPTGTAPILYLKNPAASFGTNSGTGGNLTVTGTLDVASTSPSD